MSFLIYDGPSLLDGKPIFSAISGVEYPSRNAKTGVMIQTWTMRSDISPLEAVHSGADHSICGDCSLRGDGFGGERVCYPQLFQAPTNIYNAYAKGKVGYSPLGKYLFKRQAIRFGAYGDSAAIPTRFTADPAKLARMHTGYTHQWRECDPDLKKYLMASCDSEKDREEAKALGWATFRVKTASQPRLKGETPCPASEEAGKRLTCLTCGMCCGTSKFTKDIVINVHGTGKKHFILKNI